MTLTDSLITEKWSGSGMQDECFKQEIQEVQYNT